MSHLTSTPEVIALYLSCLVSLPLISERISQQATAQLIGDIRGTYDFNVLIREDAEVDVKVALSPQLFKALSRGPTKDWTRVRVSTLKGKHASVGTYLKL